MVPETPALALALALALEDTMHIAGHTAAGDPVRFPVETDTGSGERLRLVGIETDGDGELVRVEGFLEPGAGPPMHVHFHQAEGLRVVEGSVGYRIRGRDGRIRTGSVGPGQEIVFHAGEVHRFWNDGPVPARAEGWVRPPGNFPWFITRLHASIREQGGVRPGFFEGAFLTWRFRHEFDMEEIPGLVKRLVFPVVVALGVLLGRYRKYRDAPPSPPRERHPPQGSTISGSSGKGR